MKLETIKQAVDALKNDDPDAAEQMLEGALEGDAALATVKKAIDALKNEDPDAAEQILSELLGAEILDHRATSTTRYAGTP